jgi:uncharacterized protein YbaP (TraB family)
MRVAIFKTCVLAVLAWPLAVAAQASAPACPPQTQAPTAEQVQAATRSARDRGALWRISRDGASSYLFGTLHVGKLEWALPGPQLRAALAATDTIALELDPTDPQLAARMAAPSVAGAPTRLPAALAERLARQLDAACLPAQVRPAIDGMHPVMRAVTLSVLEARWAGLDVGYAQEFALAGYGRAAQRRIVSLETPELQLAALVPSDAQEMQRMVGTMLDQLEQGATRRTVARMAEAWARGDLAELEQYERWCECVLNGDDRKLLARLLDDRNPALAERIEALHKEGRKVLAGVGALHMVGPLGLPALLRQRGFAVERLPFK